MMIDEIRLISDVVNALKYLDSGKSTDEYRVPVI